jgi:hypothetical protein
MLRKKIFSLFCVMLCISMAASSASAAPITGLAGIHTIADTVANKFSGYYVDIDPEDPDDSLAGVYGSLDDLLTGAGYLHKEKSVEGDFLTHNVIAIFLSEDGKTYTLDPARCCINDFNKKYDTNKIFDVI